MITWELLHPRMTPAHLGYLPGMISDNDPRPAREQFNERYGHGGGWFPMHGHTLEPNLTITYPGDPPFRLLARTKLRDEVILVHEHDLVTIVQSDGSYETCRMD